MSQAIIYHNPRCSKSRQTLALLQQHAIDTEVVEYLKEPIGHSEISELLKKLGISAHELIRTKEAAYKELNLADTADEKTLIDAMCQHPILIERPIVVVGDKAKIGRPPEHVLELFQ